MTDRCFVAILLAICLPVAMVIVAYIAIGLLWYR